MKIIKIVASLLLVVNIVHASAKINNYNEDEEIVKAIYYTQHKKNKEAAAIWKKLFEKTNEEKFLIEYFYSALSFKDIKDVIKEIKESLNKKKSKDLYELLASLYSKEGDTDGVLDSIEHIQDGNVESMYELAYLYSIKGKKDKALNIYRKIYKKEHSWDALKGILSILSSQNKSKEAANILWKALKSKTRMPKDAYLVYVGLIDYKKVPNRAIFAFKQLFKLTGDRRYIKQLISLYLFKKDYDSIIKILELTHYDQNLLYELYLSKQEIVNAYKTIDSLYKSSKEPKWLAEKAILTYEIANKFNAVDDKVIKRMSELFEEAFSKGVKDATYYNYYGYTLIEHNKDIKKGLELVKKAIEQEPNNIYYLDSLSWGYYKLKKCKEAKEVMRKIFKLNKSKLEDDILKHNDKIKKCKDK